MAEVEKFSWLKLLDLLNPSGYYKVIGLALRGGLILLVVLGFFWIKNILFPTASAVKDINVNKGGTVYVNNSKRRMEFFIGPTYSTDEDGKWRAGAFGGIKY